MSWKGLIHTVLLLALLLSGTRAQSQSKKIDPRIEPTDGKPVIPLPPQCHYYRTLLSLDGGGIKGLVTAQILKMLVNSIKEYLMDNQPILTTVNITTRIEKEDDFHIDIVDYFDMLSGVSGGSWIASYLATRGGHGASAQIFDLPHIKRRFGDVRPGSVLGLDVFFLEYGVYIYPPQIFPVIVKPRLFRFPRVEIDSYNVPKYSPSGLEWTLKRFLGDTKLSQSDTSLMIIAFDLRIRAAVQFICDRMQDIEIRFQQRGVQKEINREIDCLNEFLSTIDKYHKAKENGNVGEEKLLGEEMAKNYTKCSKLIDRFIKLPIYAPKQMTVRTGYVWTRMIPKDLTKDDAFSNPGMDYFGNVDYYLRDLARASSAFPLFFEAKNIKAEIDASHEFELIDGGMVGNNPTLQSIIFMSSGPNINITDVAAMSVGTGTVMRDLRSLGSSGLLAWTGQLVTLIQESSPEFIQANLDFLFYRSMMPLVQPNQYLRIQYIADENSRYGRALRSTDDVTELPTLMEIGSKTALKFKANIDHFVANFLFTSCTDPIYSRVYQERINIKQRELDAEHNLFYDAYYNNKKDIDYYLRLDEEASPPEI